MNFFLSIIHFLKKPSISKRIIVSISVTLLFMIIILVIFIFTMQDLDNYVQMLINKGTLEATVVRQVMERVSITQLNIQSFIFSRTRANYLYSKTALIELKIKLKEAYEALLPGTDNADSLKKLIHFEQINLNIFNELSTGVKGKEIDKLKILFNQNSEEINKVLTRINNNINIDLATGSRIITIRVRNARIEMIIYVLIMILFEMVIAYYLIKSIIPNINHLVLKTLEISKGDIAQRVMINTGDEMENLADNFNRMISSLELTQKSLIDKNDELVKTQNKIVAQAKLALLGQMSAGLAHEIRNPLNAIKGAAEYLLTKSKGNPVFNEYLDMVKEEVERLNRIVTEFMSLARQKEPQKIATDIESLINRIIRIVTIKSRKLNITIVKDYQANQNIVLVDPDQISQVLLNIIINAVDAVIEHGRIAITTELSERVINERLLHFLCISISDTGPGIPEHLLDKLFNPFFTTKTKGMGIGLSLSNEIVIQHDGFIEVLNDNGAVFKVYLPLERNI